MVEESCGVTDELSELLDMAIYKEIASQALYEVAQGKTDDPGAKTLMKELARDEVKHANWLKGIKEKGLTDKGWRNNKVEELKISEYLVGGDKLERAGLQDTLVFAMKREQQSVEFYLKMMEVITDKTAQRLCQRLVQAERKHNLKLEVLYDGLFYGED